MIAEMELEEVRLRLRNWDRWSRLPIVSLDICEPPIFADWRPAAGWEEGWGAEPSPALPISIPIDELAAYEIECILRRIAWRHFRAIYEAYHLHRQQVDALLLGEAERAVGDLLEAKSQKNRLTPENGNGEIPLGKVRPTETQSR